MDGGTAIEIERPRSVTELIGASFSLYLRVPILFLALAAVVVVPYELIVLLITGDGPLEVGRDGILVGQLVMLADFFLLIPLISALHVHAVREVGDGGRPRLIPTFRRSLPALPVVAVATGLAWIGTLLGFVALIVPGLMLWARWAVTSQTAALEGGGWTDALRRSADLTEGYREHAFGVIFAAGVIALLPTLALGAAFGGGTTTVGSFAAATALQIVLRSFEALATALLYFDLRARARDLAASPAAAPAAAAEGVRAAGWYIDPSQPDRMRYWAADGTGWSEHTAGTPKAMLREWRERHLTEAPTPAMAAGEHTGHSLDPDVYSDAGRPSGWYVDPDRPWRMRYWRTGEHEGWSKETTKTPERAQAEWRDLRWRR